MRELGGRKGGRKVIKHNLQKSNFKNETVKIKSNELIICPSKVDEVSVLTVSFKTRSGRTKYSEL